MFPMPIPLVSPFGTESQRRNIVFRTEIVVSKLTKQKLFGLKLINFRWAKVNSSWKVKVEERKTINNVLFVPLSTFWDMGWRQDSTIKAATQFFKINFCCVREEVAWGEKRK
jgi:hypothetical protein